MDIKGIGYSHTGQSVAGIQKGLVQATEAIEKIAQAPVASENMNDQVVSATLEGQMGLLSNGHPNVTSQLTQSMVSLLEAKLMVQASAKAFAVENDTLSYLIDIKV